MKKLILITCVSLLGLNSNAQDSLDCFLNANFTYSISGGEITFTNTSTGEPIGAMYDWWIDGLSSTDENPTFPTTDFEETEEVCFTVYNADWSCTDSLCSVISFVEDSVIVIDSTECMLNANFTYSISGGVITFTNTSTGEPIGAMYDWWIDGLSSTDENPTFPTTDFEETEEVCFTVYNADWSCADSLCAVISFVEDSVIVIDSTECMLNANFTYSISGGVITFTNTSTGEPIGAMYDWWIDGLSSTDENPTFPTTDFEETEEVCFTVYNADWSCTDSLCLEITITDDEPDTTASLFQLEEKTMEIYPNPAADRLTISLKNTSTVQNVYVFNALGEMVKMDQIGISTSTLELNVEHLPSGLYIIHLVDEENPANNSQQKFVKK